MNFSEEYFKLLEEVTPKDGKSRVKANSNEELWKNIKKYINDELKKFFENFKFNQYIGQTRTKSPGQNGSYYSSHWGFIYKEGNETNAGINMTIDKDYVSFRVDIARDKYSINSEQEKEINDLSNNSIKKISKEDAVIDENVEKALKDYIINHEDDYNEIKKIEKKLPLKSTKKDKNITPKNDEIIEQTSTAMSQPLNQILYGPPGTGKTYNTIFRALEILEPNNSYASRYEAVEEFNKYKKQGRIVFTTFHQSMSYEDFVEGIKPNIEDDELSYEKVDGIFKELVNKAKEDCVSQQNANTISINTGAAFDDFLTEVEQGNIIIKTKTDIDLNIYSINSGRRTISFANKTQGKAVNCVSFTRLMKLDSALSDEDLDNINVNTIREKIGGCNTTYYWSVLKAFRSFLKEKDTTYKVERKTDNKPYVIIIDEINRGNISSIFGELITLIEEDKRIGRPEALSVTLPYSKEEFGIPDNLYIIGTMNTADRSVEALDSALRRRFTFVEMMPNPSLLSTDIDGINLQNLLKTINERLVLLKDREHQIGHSYFINVKNKNELKDAIFNKIIPLLQEYFYGDYEKIQMVLGDAFVTKKSSNTIFAVSNADYDSPEVFEIAPNTEDFDLEAALESIKFGYKKNEKTT